MPNAAAKAEVRTRTRRNPAEKAQLALVAANTRYAKAEEKRNRLKDELAAAQQELEVADKLARYAANHPDLSGQNVSAGDPTDVGVSDG